jgi:hypothetical protein
MKKYLFVFLVFGIGNAYAQKENGKEISPAQSFSDRKGTVIEKRYDEVGKVGFVTVQIAYITDLTNSDKMECIDLDFQPPPNTTGQQVSGLLDTNQINGLLTFVNYITSKVTTHPPVDPNTEISFTDKYDFQIGCFWKKGAGWILFLQMDSQKPSTETDIYQADIAGFVKIMNLAKTEIQKP